MKLESTLPERVGFLHAVPIFDLFALLLVALLLGQSFMNEAGVQVELPMSPYQVARSADSTVITVSRGNPPALWLDRERVSEEELVERLRQLNEESGSIPSVIVKADASIPSGYVRRVEEAALAQGFRVFAVARPLVEEE